MKNTSTVTNTNTSKTVYVYNKDKQLKGTYSLSKYASMKGVNVQSIKEAVTSHCNYGYVKGDYVSLSPIDKFLSVQEMMDTFSLWLKTNLKKFTSILKKTHKSKYDVELLYTAITYISQTIADGGVINNYGKALIYKYKTYDLNEIAKNKNIQRKGFISDFEVYSGEDRVSYIDTYASEDDYFWTNRKYDCIEDYNSIKQLDVIGYILKEKFLSKEVDIFVDALQGNYTFTSLEEIPTFKYKTLIRKYKNELNELKKIDNRPIAKLSNSAYIVELFRECWEELKRCLQRIKDEEVFHTFKSLDNYTLANLIE